METRSTSATTAIVRTGPMGALLDEYERALRDLYAVIDDLTDMEFRVVRNPKATDPDCRSIQMIVRHVLRAGYGYDGYIRRRFELPGKDRGEVPAPVNAKLAIHEMKRMFQTSEKSWMRLADIDEETLCAHTFDCPWGQTYDLEQMIEHAIVHVLRHRRQIEAFLTTGGS